YTLSLHDALPIFHEESREFARQWIRGPQFACRPRGNTRLLGGKEVTTVSRFRCIARTILFPDPTQPTRKCAVLTAWTAWGGRPSGFRGTAVVGAMESLSPPNEGKELP